MTNVKLIGWVDDTQLIDYYRSADILVALIDRKILLNNWNDISFYTSPLKLKEYLVFNKPIITTNVPCTNEYRAIPYVWSISLSDMQTPSKFKSLVESIMLNPKNLNSYDIFRSRQESMFTWSDRASLIWHT